MNKKLKKIKKKSKKLFIDDSTKIVIMSDCHRGAGDNFDNFLKNKNIVEAALAYYYDRNFIYIELGDGDDMWEVKNYQDILDVNIDIFKLLKKYYESNRLIMIYGNHDISKKSRRILERYFYKHYNKVVKQDEELLNDLIVYESLILNYKDYEIFLIHGHQIDFLNSTLWPFSRFLVRYVWRFLERIGVKDPTSTAKGYRVKNRIEKRLKKWSIKNNIILIAGHTHRAIFPKVGQSLYFNDGSCIHPNGITCLEIEKGNISLVKWEYKVNEDRILYVERKLLEGNESIINFFKKVK